MPYRIIKVMGGYKVQNKLTKKVYSNHPQTHDMAVRQLRALYANFKGGFAELVEEHSWDTVQVHQEYLLLLSKVV